MRRVKIKSVPTGKQVNYSLWRNQKVYNNATTEPKVSNTMGATKDGDANVEVEGGETAVGDINLDGLIELMSFQGKRHSQGGMPVKLPEGTFIYSDTPKLRIKDPEILAMFNMPKKKNGGYTPAEISKQYLDLNSHIDTLKNPDSDLISRQTAEMMVKKNTAKLGELALIQESMKGFENGVPSIAESALAGLSPEAQQVAKCGGRVKMQKAGETPRPNKAVESFATDWWEKTKQNANFIGETISNAIPYKEDAEYFVEKGKKMGLYTMFPPKAMIDAYKNDKNILYAAPNVGAFLMSAVAGAPSPIPWVFGTEMVSSAKPVKLTPNMNLDSKKIVTVNKNNYKMQEDGSLLKQDPVYIDKWIPVTDKKEYDVVIATDPMMQHYGKHNSIKTEQYTTTSKPTTSGSTNSVKPPFKGSTQKSNIYNQAVSKYEKFGGQLTKYQLAGEVIETTEKEGKKYYNDIEITKGDKADRFEKDGKIYYIKENKIVAVNDTKSGKLVEANQDGTFTISMKGDGKTNIQYISKTNPDTYDYEKSKYKENVQTFNTFIDSDEDLQNDIYTNFKKRYKESYDNIIANPKKYGHTSETVKMLPKPDDITKEQALSILKRGNEENSKILTYYGDTDILKDKSWDDWTGGRNYYYNNLAKSVGITPMTDAETLMFQTAYQGTSDASRLEKNKEKFRNQGFNVTPLGYDDETWNEKGNISHGDMVYGNTTLGEIIQRQEPSKPNEGEMGPPEPNIPIVPASKEETNSPPPFEEPRRDIDTWFAPDIMNFVGAMTDRINRYEPSQGKIDLVKPGYDLLSPDRQLAANQEQMARYQNQIENSVDSNVGLATMLAASGAGFQNAANVLANVENANVGIVNNAYGQRAAIENQEIASNETMRQKYIQDMAILNQNQDEAENARKWRRIGAWNQGWENYTKDKQMEEILFPQVHIDNITGEYSFPGGRDPNAIDLYRNYYLGQQSQKGRRQQMSADDYLDYYKQFSTEYKKRAPDAKEEDVRGLFNNWVRMANTDQYMLYGSNVYPF